MTCTVLNELLLLKVVKRFTDRVTGRLCKVARSSTYRLSVADSQEEKSVLVKRAEVESDTEQVLVVRSRAFVFQLNVAVPKERVSLLASYLLGPVHRTAIVRSMYISPIESRWTDISLYLNDMPFP